MKWLNTNLKVVRPLLTVIVGLFGVLSIIASGGGGGGGGDSDGTGGGGGGPTASSPEGLWIGTTSTGRSFAGLVLDDGVYWFLYSLIGDEAVIAGAVQGTITSGGEDGTFQSTDGRDFNLEGLGINDIDIDAMYVMEQTLDGTGTYSGTDEEVTFASTYDSDYEITPDLNTIDGTYLGDAATTGGAESATVAISNAGDLSGIGDSGCEFVGSVSPRMSGNVYDVTVTFQGGVCANGTDTVNGIAYFDADESTLYSLALNDSRTNGYIFVGVLQ